MKSYRISVKRRSNDETISTEINVQAESLEDAYILAQKFLNEKCVIVHGESHRNLAAPTRRKNYEAFNF